MSNNFWPHQEKTYKFHVDTECGADFSDAGTAKTYPHIKIAETFLERGGSRVVIVSPKILMRSAWLNEIQERTPNLNDCVAIAEPPSDNRLCAFNSNKEIVLINIDAMIWLASQKKKWLQNRLGANALLIIDESHSFKNAAAKRTKAAIQISELFSKRHILSGTPTPSSVTELWSQMMILDRGTRLGTRYASFRNYMQRPVQKGPFVTWVDKPEASLITHELIKDITIRHQFHDVMKFAPEMQQQVVFYDLPKKHRAVYDRLEHQSYLDYGDKAVSALNAGILANKLLQVASGAVYHDGSNSEKTWELIDSGRYELIAELVESRPYSLVFMLWQHQKKELERIFTARKISYEILDGTIKSSEKRAETVAKFQRGELRTLLLHPKTAAYGLTLTRAATAIYCSPLYDASAKVQADARILRGTQDKQTESIVVLGRDTRDQHAYEVFSGKLDRLTALNDLFAG